MTKLLKYNIEGKKLKEVELAEDQLDDQVHPQMLKDYIVAINKNQRQWSANTKGRSEVNHSNQKPHKQKGTGKARQGTLAAPQYKGGGVVFGPKPKFNQFVKINKKERQAIVRALISQKIKENHCLVISDTDMKEAKTKVMQKFLQSSGIKHRVLFIGEVDGPSANELTESNQPIQNRKHFNFQLSLRNIPKTEFSLIDSVNGYQIIKAKHLVFTEKGLKQFLEQGE